MERAFPYALSIGMTYDQYWKCSPYLYLDYKEADEIRTMRENHMMWLQGIYNMNAFRVIMDKFSNGLSGQNHPVEPYYEYPIPITEREKEEEHRRNVEKTLKFFLEGQKQK
jgi:hypothetical protein